MLVKLLRPLRRRMNTLKWETDRRYAGIWIGSPPPLLRAADLLAGDVLFCAGTDGAKRGRLIEEATDGGYVHCAIYIGHSKVAEARTDGVRIQALDHLAKLYPYMAAARCHGNEQRRSRRKAIVRYCQQAAAARMRTRYNIWGSLLLPLRELADLKALASWSSPVGSSPAVFTRPRRLFCSQLVVDAYVSCGYIPKTPECSHYYRLSPNGLAEENIFTLVGYLADGWEAISPQDHFLAGCDWVLGEEGRARLERDEQWMLAHIDMLPGREVLESHLDERSPKA